MSLPFGAVLMSDYLHTLARAHAERRNRLWPVQPPRMCASWPIPKPVKPYKFKRAKLYREWGDPAKARKFVAGLTAQRVIGIVARHYCVRAEGIPAKIRSIPLVKPRHMAMFLCREFIADASFPEIAWQFGRRHHTTVLSACQLVALQLWSDPSVKAHYDKLRAKLIAWGDRT